MKVTRHNPSPSYSIEMNDEDAQALYDLLAVAIFETKGVRDLFERLHAFGYRKSR